MIVSHVLPDGWEDTEESGKIQPSEVVGLVHEVTLSPEDVELLRGLPGEKGEKGDTGAQGAQGVKGDTGAQGIVPAGAVVFFAMAAAPVGWLVCNGAAVSRSVYSALFAAVGVLYGAGNGSTTFNLPDLRGEFLRGLDGGRGVDAGRALGSAQADMLKSHTHTATTTGSPNGDSNSIGYAGGAPALTERSIINVTGGVETRPRNVALLPCISTGGA